MSAIILQFGRMENAPNRIRAIRESRKMSQQALGDAINLSRMSISDIETGKINLSLDHMRRISKVFGMPPVDLLNEDDQNEFLRREEMSLVRAYRAADAITREMFHRVAETRSEYTPGTQGNPEEPENTDPGQPQQSQEIIARSRAA